MSILINLRPRVIITARHLASLEETGVAPRPHANRDARDERYWTDFTMPDEVTPIRVRIGQRQRAWDALELDAAECNSGLVGHPA